MHGRFSALSLTIVNEGLELTIVVVIVLHQVYNTVGLEMHVLRKYVY